MTANAPLIDPTKIDFNRVVATLEDIRKVNPQRYEFEQITAVGSSRVDLQACKLEYSIVSPK